MGLAGWPGHTPATDEVEMQVAHRLASVGSDVGQEPPTGVELQFGCQFLGGGNHLPDQPDMLRTGRPQRLDVISGDDQHVHRCHRVEVMKRDHPRRVCHHLCGNLSCRDPAEDTVGIDQATTTDGRVDNSLVSSASLVSRREASRRRSLRRIVSTRPLKSSRMSWIAERKRSSNSN